MKKDKKWFIDKWTKERDKTDVHDPMYHFITEFITDVRLLDEPEVSPQYSIDENKEDSDVHYIGYSAPIGRVHDLTLNDEAFARAWLSGYEEEEESLYYALVKGHELMVDEDGKYWNLRTSDGVVFLSDRFSRHDGYLTVMTKEDWANLGINDSNADFVKVV